MSVKRFDAQRWMGGAAAPPTEAEVTAKILSILSCYDKIAPADLTIDGDFMDDMGLDSLDVVECVMAIEEEFSIELDDTQAEIIRSPKEMIAFIMAH
eukprot:gene22289-29786_t